MKKYVLLIVLVMVAIRFLNNGSVKPQVAQEEKSAAQAAALVLKPEGVRSYWTNASK